MFKNSSKTMMPNAYNDVTKVVNSNKVLLDKAQILYKNSIKDFNQLNKSFKNHKTTSRKLFLLDPQKSLLNKGQRKGRGYRIARLPKP